MASRKANQIVGKRQEPPPAPLPTELTDPVDQAALYDEGYRTLGVAILQDVLAHDPDWFTREAGALRFWGDLVGVNPDALQEALRRWQAGQPVA